MKPELVALSTAVILGIYGAGYVTTQSTASLLAPPSRPTAAAQVATHYRDGTYSATGMSPYGDVTVAVTIQHARIANVQITDCTTHFPEAWIDGMPGEVLAAQNTNIDWVSGATGSSYAFVDAVTQALAQAAGQPATPAGSQ
jgi:uncharacterized protein with FMN-binding domain